MNENSKSKTKSNRNQSEMAVHSSILQEVPKFDCKFNLESVV